ncbi:Chromatin structure remodeling complex protein sfh1 [Marasmius crinis-equi]|uniref:Chromatin structure remodeling complex protein sfh1 n=1 Tax=Marasmius crinis-equi TaxID=585013 RepID=A0ABR3FWH7_9AGAR
MSDGFRNLTDYQLKQAIGQLQHAATSYISPVPQQANSLTYQKNLQAWSSTPTPPPRNASAGTRPSRARNTRSSNLVSSTPTPTAAPVTTPANRPPRTTSTSTSTPTPAPMRPAVQPVPQAFQSTYGSRLRTGATLLMQPILSSAPVASSSSAYPAPLTSGTRSSRRTGTVVNYADPGSGDEFPDAGAIDSDDSDFIASGGTRTSIRQKGGRQASVGTFGAQLVGGSIQSGASETLDQSYLGMVPPDRFIKPRYIMATPHEYPSEEAILRQSLRRTALVPIRIEFDTENHRIRDCFVWNLYDDTIKPESFAKIFCKDLDLPSDPWEETVSNQIKAQLEDSEGVATMELGMDGAVDLDAQAEDLSLTEDDSMQVEDDANVIPECRVILSIDVQIANYHLLDHIEWDLLSPLTPEAFASTLCKELGLSGEAIPLVAHAVHEELIKHKKDAVEWGVIGGPTDREPRNTPANPENVKRDKSGAGLMKDKTGLGLAWGRAPKDGRGPKPLRSVWRDWAEAEEFRTRFEELSQEEVERRELERERAARRLRRETIPIMSTGASFVPSSLPSPFDTVAGRVIVTVAHCFAVLLTGYRIAHRVRIGRYAWDDIWVTVALVLDVVLVISSWVTVSLNREQREKGPSNLPDYYLGLKIVWWLVATSFNALVW